MSWYLYSEEFINKGLSGDISYAKSEKRFLIGKLVFHIQPVLFFLLSIPCRVPLIDQICEIVATHWSRGLIGFLLRGIYWKTKLGAMGQNVFIDRWVSIYPAKNVFLGNDIHFDIHVAIQSTGGKLVVGDRTQILANSYLNCRPFIILGRNVSIGNNCILYGGSTSLVDEEGRYLPWSSMDPRHKDLLCGIIFEDYSGLVNNVVCCPDPWTGKIMDEKRELCLESMTIGKWTGIGSNSYLSRSTGKAEMWIGNPAKMIFDYKIKIKNVKDKYNRDLLEYVKEIKSEL